MKNGNFIKSETVIMAQNTQIAGMANSVTETTPFVRCARSSLLKNFVAEI